MKLLRFVVLISLCLGGFAAAAESKPRRRGLKKTSRRGLKKKNSSSKDKMYTEKKGKGYGAISKKSKTYEKSKEHEMMGKGLSSASSEKSKPSKKSTHQKIGKGHMKEKSKKSKGSADQKMGKKGHGSKPEKAKKSKKSKKSRKSKEKGNMQQPIIDCPYNNIVQGKCKSSKEIADAVVEALFADFDADTAAAFLDPNYIQHNPSVPTGAGPLLDLIPALKESGIGIEVHRTLEMDNLVAYHSTYTNAQLFGGGTVAVGFDVYRVQDGVVMEHWDNLQELAGPSPSGHTVTGGTTMVTDREETENNKALVIAFIETILIDGEFDQMTQFISTENFTQRNPQIGDGIDGLTAALTSFAEAGMSMLYHSIEFVIADGNFVLVGSSGDFGGPSAYYDLFRIEDGLIVEHWDVIQEIPPVAEFVHQNGKF